MRTVAFCEIDPYCRAVLAKHWPGVPCFEDVRTLTAADVGPVDVICGGWPCQTFSTAARGRNVQPNMWPDFYRIIRSLRPNWILAENVSRALHGWNGIQSDLQDAGYISTAVDTDTALPERQRGRFRAIIVAHTDSHRESWRSFNEKASCIREIATGIRDAFPGTLGMADGVPGRLDRLRCLGNAVVPQIPEIIGRAIIEAENEWRR